jgi:hypothetical protein
MHRVFPFGSRKISVAAFRINPPALSARLGLVGNQAATSSASVSDGPCVDGSGLARAFFTRAAVVGAAMCSAC